ncbi:MAG: DUF2339 domain-containing protein [Treponema sp.]|jgi:uncharacterized membrane protein|nr:DUF2339 domain-containing protein [Treponema sp.]
MAGIIFLVVAAFLFSVVGVIALLVKVSRQEELLREYGERLDRVEGALRPSVLRPSPQQATVMEVELPPYTPDTEPAPENTPAPGETWTVVETPLTRAPPRNFLPGFIRRVNLWAAGGILLLLAGFATLVTYLASRGFFTAGMGIAAAALCGLVMLVLGWRFRKKRPVYFLLLQGGGIGILYFSVFAAHKLTPYFPAQLGLVFMSLLIPPALVLALFQNSQVLALAGFLGGFAAPLLMAWARGNQVFLFAYYLILDLGVLCIGFFRRWKPLNLLALLCSFFLANVWTMRYYKAELFWSAEPFFLAYIVIFTVLGFRGSGIKIAPNFDMALILGTPVLAAPLQWKVFEPVEHGHALVCLVFSAFYIVSAFVMWKRRRGTGERILYEACLGFGVLLANVAIPLELSPGITSAVWAAEGLVVFLPGLRLKKNRITAAALVLHAAGAIAFFFEAGSRVDAGFLSAGFTGSLVIALSALAMVYCAEHFSHRPRPALSLVLAVWGFLWWFGGWCYGIYRGLDNPAAILFLVCSLSALASYGASRRFQVPLFRLGLIPSLAAAFLVWFGFFIVHSSAFFTRRSWVILSHNYFAGAYGWAWVAFLAVQGVLIFLSQRELREDIHGIWILIVVCISLGLVSSSGRSLTIFWNLAPAWTSFAGLLPVFAAMTGISFLARRLPGNVNQGGGSPLTRSRLVFFVLPLILSCVLGFWFLVTLFFSGDPAPLPFYIPILNPLDLEELFCIVIFLLWQSALMKRNDLPVLKKRGLFTIVDSTALLYAIAAVARGVHFYGGIAYRGIVYSDVFHLCLFILLALYGMGHIIGGTRLSRRWLWIAGAVLMLVDTAKFLLLDQASAGAAVRIVSFFLAGLLFLVIGWAAPLPPSSGKRENRDG